MERGTTRVLHGTLLAGILGLLGTVTAQGVDPVDPDEETTTRFKRGDVNCDGCVNSSDAILLRQHLFGDTDLPCDCHDARDASGDGEVTAADGVCLLDDLFNDRSARLPCGNGHHTHASNIVLLNWRGTGQSAVLDMADAISLFRWLFMGGPPHPLGLDCVWIESCPTVARCASCPELTPTQEAVDEP